MAWNCQDLSHTKTENAEFVNNLLGYDIIFYLNHGQIRVVIWSLVAVSVLIFFVNTNIETQSGIAGVSWCIVETKLCQGLK